MRWYKSNSFTLNFGSVMLYFEHKSNSMQSLLGRIQISIRETNRASACNWHSTRVVQVDGVTSKDYPSEEIVSQFPLYIPRPLLSVRSITWTTVHAKLQFLRGSAIITYLLINQRENSGHGWRLAIGPNWQELNDPLVFIHKWLVFSILHIRLQPKFAPLKNYLILFRIMHEVPS